MGWLQVAGRALKDPVLASRNAQARMAAAKASGAGLRGILQAEFSPYSMTQAADTAPYSDPSWTGQMTPSPYGDTTDYSDYGTGGGTPYTPNMVFFKGIQYDLNNEADRNAFIQVQSAEVDRKLNEALKSGQLGYAAKLLDFKHAWEAQGKELSEGYSQGQTARQQRYQGLGTRAYQSSMGASGQYALNKLGEAQNERNYQKGQFETGLERAYNDWIRGAGEQAQAEKDILATNVGNIGGFDTSKISNAQADLSAYTPYTNFQSLAASPMVTSPAKSLAPAQQMTLAQWLQQYSGKETNPLNAYLQGKA